MKRRERGRHCSTHKVGPAYFSFLLDSFGVGVVGGVQVGGGGGFHRGILIPPPFLLVHSDSCLWEVSAGTGAVLDCSDSDALFLTLLRGVGGAFNTRPVLEFWCVGSTRMDADFSSATTLVLGGTRTGEEVKSSSRDETCKVEESSLLSVLLMALGDAPLLPSLLLTMGRVGDVRLASTLRSRCACCEEQEKEGSISSPLFGFRTRGLGIGAFRLLCSSDT